MHRLWLIFCQTVTIGVGILFVITTFRPDWLPTGHPPSSLGSPEPPFPSPLPQPSSAQPTSFALAAQRSMPAVVHVFTTKAVRQPRHPLANDPLFRHFFGDRPEDGARQQASGLGSGVIVGPEGYIVTNNHVIEAADGIEIALNDGRKFPAQVVGRDPETDLAVLRITPSGTLPTLALAPRDSLQVGDVVLAIGNPFGVGQTVTMGIVSALDRSHLGINTFEDYIQTDAAINPGNSGGALVDTTGNLVGINSAIYSRSGGSLGIGFAIPVSLVQSVMEQIIQSGEVTRGWIGVEIQEVTRELAESFDLPDTQGVLISGVMRGGPADRAGIRPGDILRAIEGHPVNEPQRMLEQVAGLNPGTKARVTLMRNRKELPLAVEISRRPIPKASQP
ncbi:MAG: Do family serine endopeptidase [Rhodocyclaceae bacterium]|nr:Do family serine endopeptidase [Rhodocyclaceae bacterium]